MSITRTGLESCRMAHLLWMPALQTGCTGRSGQVELLRCLSPPSPGLTSGCIRLQDPELLRFIDIECYCWSTVLADFTPMINSGMVFCDRHFGGINYPRVSSRLELRITRCLHYTCSSAFHLFLQDRAAKSGQCGLLS